ncbi:LmeA family phospholipid-binding protein [Mycobacterium barrassiae]|uniref:DUF2993 domain-containing protein n=1 Tax=Mycobacterium barrassiae TaxID=319709 RepID=UPI002265A2EC|nr:DUF2993 domain-containing protein [Mycobacterium barrassiae]MCV7301502.1 LmeA family phospholipid-binding protein [Mycobacterium barrassiae]
MTYPTYARSTLTPTTPVSFHSAPTQGWPIPAAPAFQPPVPPPAQPPVKRKRFRGPIAFVLILVIVLAVAAAGLLATELYARTVAVGKVKSAAACFIEGSESAVDVTFETSPPVLMQYINDKYTGFTITTNGSDIRGVDGITADIAVDDLDLNGDATKRGTIGAIDATIAWTNEGLRESANTALKEAIDEYLADSFLSFLSDWISTDEVVTSVTTDPSTGIVTLNGMFDSSIAIKPVTTDGGIRMVIQPDSFWLGGNLDLPQDDLQEKLDEMTGELTDNKYGLGVDSLDVTDSGVVAKLSATNVEIPASDGTSSCLDI